MEQITVQAKLTPRLCALGDHLAVEPLETPIGPICRSCCQRVVQAWGHGR